MDIVKLSQVLTGRLPYENINSQDAVVLIGSADYGPSMLPIKATNVNEIIDIFGLESLLTNAYIEYAQFGMGDVYLIRMNGVPAEVDINGMIKITTIDASDEGNQLQCSIQTVGTTRYLEVTNVDGSSILQYDITDLTIQELEDKINRDAYSSISPVYAVASMYGSCDLLIDTDPVIFSGGDKDIYFNETNIYDKLEAILNNLLDSSVKQIGLLNGDILRPIDGRGYLYSMLSNFANEKAIKTQPCVITIGQGSSGMPNLLYVNSVEFAKYLGNLMNIECMLSEYVNIIVGKLKVSGTSDSYISDGTASYCSLISTLSIGQSTTNKVLSGALDEISGYTDDELRTLSKFGYVTFLKNGSNGVKVNNGTNMLYGTGGKYYVEFAEYSKPNSLVYLSNVLVIQGLAYELYDGLDPLVGNMINKNQVELVVKEIMKSYKTLIKEYDFEINEFNEGYTKNYELNITIALYGEVDTMTFTVSLW